MESLLESLQYLAAPKVFLLMAIGTTAGIVVGAIPGLTGAMVIALALPLTFGMAGEDALVLLVSMYVGSVSGGLITATLLRMPGTPASIMTTLDGYPMAQSGRAGRALGLGIGASLIGGLISWAFLLLLAAPMAAVSHKLGPFDFFSLVAMAMVLIAMAGGGSMAKGLFAGFLGILASMPGTHPATGQVRLTLGMTELDDGFKLLPVLIGLYALSQVVRDIVMIDRKAEVIGAPASGVLMRSKAPDEFGKGSEEGVVASEAANNATVGGALIPLIALGIPGSVIDAILLGAMVIHGLQPGPLLFEQNPQAVGVIISTVLVANLFMAVFMTFSVRWLARLTDVPKAYLIPVILVFCVVGSYGLSNRMFDVWVMVFFGAVGLAMERWKIPLAPFVIGFVLAPIAEQNLCSGLMTTGGSYLPIFTRPISLVFVLVAVGLGVWTVVGGAKKDVSDEA
ncbi:MAG: tripartite tricarboxylate transporter permease [Planctomycetota bacterium]|jgi:putative tricarboxylic transport membrane protein